MADAPRERSCRSRQACEPCREKKIKCPSERPTCSSCARLRRPCTYRGRKTRQSAGVERTAKKASPLCDRFQRLESSVENLYTLLQSSHSQTDSSAPSVSPWHPASAGSGQDLLDPNGADVSHTSRPEQMGFASARLEDVFHLLSDAVDLYLKVIHLQPLPLFRASELLDYLRNSGRHLVCSLLSLSFYVKSPGTPPPPLSEAAHRYVTSAEADVKKLALEGKARIDIVQSLCLLALRDMLACKPQQAQMTIATASHLEACRLMSDDTPEETSDNDLSLRCRWSVNILENISRLRLHALEAEIPEPPFPNSAAVPAALLSPRQQDYPPDLYNPYSTKTDHGIQAYYIRMLSNWSHISDWLSHVRLGNVESPWKPESKCARLISRIYDCDSQLPSKHLLMNLDFSKRSSSEVSQAREYWIPWILMQIQCHAFLSILSHPFIHLVAIHKCSVSTQSSLFLQRTIDAARFHSSGALRFIRLGEEQQLELYDPLVGHLVAAVGTVFWLLQFVQDKEVSEKAICDVNYCHRYLVRLSDTWPHIRRKTGLLETLQQIAEGYWQDENATRGVIAFPPGLLWELLNTEMYPKSAHRTGTGTPPTRVQITTHLTHPLTDEQSLLPSNDTEFGAAHGFAGETDSFQQFHIDDLMSQFMMYNNCEMEF